LKRSLRGILATAALAAGLGTAPLGGAYASGSGYMQNNLISNNTATIPAAHEDPTLLNPWGIAFFPGGPFWINDNGSGLSALYQGNGKGFLGMNPAPSVTIPTPSSTGTSAPTGIVANSSFGFVLKGNSMPALFIFDTEDGTISAWNLPLGVSPMGASTMAELEVDNSAEPCANGTTGAVYKGLALGANSTGVFLYATNFRCGTVDVFDSTFTPATLTGNFQDSHIPSGFAPFGIANILGNLVVTYAEQNATKHDDVAGPGNGFVDVFDTNGNLIERLVKHGHLNSPWGIALAPANFGSLSGKLLIGNFGDGRINAYEPVTGQFVDEVQDANGKAITIDGLWSLTFGGAAASDPGSLYFTAGPNGETDGLFGEISPR
jgi:uncharacterized protein (TIGR03118 family)